MQGDDPHYLKLVATAKHYVVHSGPEPERHRFDVHPSEIDLHETYLPAFQALVEEAHVGSVMGAYNRVNGESASASPRLLQQILRKQWGFQGYVVSDCDAVEDIFTQHKIVATAEEAAALALRSGLDLNCGKTFGALVNAVHQGLVSEADVDTAARRLMRARFELGMFDPPERVPWSRLPYSVNQSPEHDRLALRAAQASIVLLKNEHNTLPLSRTLRSLAVIGPTADEIMSLLGNYYGTPAAPVTILQGIRAAVGSNTRVTYARGADLVEGHEDARAVPVIESKYLRPEPGSSAEGLKGEYFSGRDFSGAPNLTRVDPRVAFRWDRVSPTDDLVARGELPPERALGAEHFSVRWTGQLLPPVSGRYEIEVGADDGFRLYVDNRLVLDAWQTASRLQSKSAFLDLQAEKAYDIRLEYFQDTRDAEVRLAWRLPGFKPPFEEALDVARAADAIVFVGGLTGDVEGEEMKVNYPGFAGGDRTDLRLPATQEKLLEALQATGKPVVLVLTSGSALAIDWAKAHIPAIVVAWYPGQRGGTAVADVLFGAYDPAGRLPVTFYKAAEKLPAFDDYSMKGRTYRYFDGEPLYPFGFGLSYTSFRYSGLTLDHSSIARNGTLNATVHVKNVGERGGDEVVQLYVRPPDTRYPRPRKELRGFRRISLAAGEEQEVTFTLKPERDTRRYDVKRKAYVVDAGRYEVQIGASSQDIRQKATFTIR
jgi:beta-glucosidase